MIKDLLFDLKIDHVHLNFLYKSDAQMYAAERKIRHYFPDLVAKI